MAATVFHVVLVALLLSSVPAPHAPRPAAPIMIDLIEERIDPPHPAEPPKPRVKPMLPIPMRVAPPEIVMAPADTPAALVAPPPPEPAIVQPIETMVAPDAAPSAPPVPPRFNVKNGRKTRSRSAGAMPGPLSLTERRDSFADGSMSA